MELTGEGIGSGFGGNHPTKATFYSNTSWGKPRNFKLPKQKMEGEVGSQEKKVKKGKQNKMEGKTEEEGKPSKEKEKNNQNR